MERRLVLAGLAALAATPALAQSSPAPATDAPAAAAPAPGDAVPAAAPAMKVAAPMATSETSDSYMKRTLAAGSLSLATSRAAAPKLRHAALKQFAGFEIAEQETIASILKAMSMPGKSPSGTVASPSDTEVMAALDPKGKAMVDKLMAAKAGAELEREYLRVQVEGHKELLAIEEAYLKAPESLDETNVAKLAKGMITEHLALLADIAKQLG